MFAAIDIPPARLINQQIAQPTFTNPKDVVACFGAMQAQEYDQAKWAIGLRLCHAKDADVEKCFADGTIIRTHILRPTWHFVAAADLRWLLMLSAPRVNAANTSMYNKYELDAKFCSRCYNITTKELEGGKQLTRATINAAFKKKKIVMDGVRLGILMMRAELDGIVCSGSRTGKQFTYTLLDERVPAVDLIERDEALSELITKYFKSRGPATLRDFSTWSGLTITDAKRGIEMVSKEFIKAKINNEEYYFTELTVTNKAVNKVWLLPIYDEYIIGYKSREAILKLSTKLNLPVDIVFNNTIVVNGQVAGLWKRTVRSNSIDLACTFLKALTKEQSKAFKKAVDQFEKFKGLPVNVVEA